MEDITLNDLVKLIRQSELSHAQKAVCFLWWMTEYAEDKAERRIPASQLVKCIEHNNLGRPTKVSLIRTIPKLGLTYKRGESFELKLGSDEAVKGWLAMEADAPATAVKGSGINLLDPAIYSRLPHYLRAVFDQINACYAARCWDAVAVLMRKMTETLLVSCFIVEKKDDLIRNKDGDFAGLTEIIDMATRKEGLDIRREPKEALTHLRNIGHMAAHSPFHNARKNDFELHKHQLRLLFERLVNVAYPG